MLVLFGLPAGLCRVSQGDAHTLGTQSKKHFKAFPKIFEPHTCLELAPNGGGGEDQHCARLAICILYRTIPSDQKPDPAFWQGLCSIQAFKTTTRAAERWPVCYCRRLGCCCLSSTPHVQLLLLGPALLLLLLAGPLGQVLPLPLLSPLLWLSRDSGVMLCQVPHVPQRVQHAVCVVLQLRLQHAQLLSHGGVHKPAPEANACTHRRKVSNLEFQKFNFQIRISNFLTLFLTPRVGQWTCPVSGSSSLRKRDEPSLIFWRTGVAHTADEVSAILERILSIITLITPRKSPV